MAIPKTLSTERDMDITQDVVPAGSVFALEVREHHEFEEDEFLSEYPVMKKLEERHFNKMERTSDYVFHLPEEDRPDDPYPWEDRRWQGEWLWHEGGIGRAESYFWFVAMTHPARLTDTRTNYKAARDLRRIRHVAADRFDAEEARDRIRTFFDALDASRRPLRWASFSYLTRLLRPLLAAEVILDLLFDVIPADHVRHFFAHLVEPADEQERASLLSAARRHLAALDYVDESSIYTGIRLLERIPDAEESERLMRAILEVEGSATMARDAVNILRDSERFAHWFAKVPEYALAPEAIPFVFGKGGFEVVAPLLRRVLAANTSFQMIAIKDLIRIHSHRAVEGFLGLYDSSAVGPMAHAWLTSEGANAIKGLIPIATNHSPLTHVAQRVLREYRDRGHERDHRASRCTDLRGHP